MGHPPVLRAEMGERSTERPEGLPAPPTAPVSRETNQYSVKKYENPRTVSGT